MSFYTGRTAFSHGATWNFVPLPIGEVTLGEHLGAHGIRTALVGKTHMMPDLPGMERVGLSRDTERGLVISECGSEPYERDDGEHAHPKADPDLAYNRYLREQGYEGSNPWNDYSNSGAGPDGELHRMLFERIGRRKNRVGITTERVRQRTDGAHKHGTMIGYW